jgi:DUF1009 family protein
VEAPSDPPACVGLIAGAGALPRLIAEERARRAQRYLVVAFEGAAPDWIGGHPHAIVAFEKPGALFRALRAAGVDTVVFAGGLARPQLRPLRFDATAIALAPTILPLLRQGDDALLRGLAATFEREGFRLAGAHALLGGLLAPDGPIAARRPSDHDRADIERAATLAAALGALDVGQGAVVEDGACLGLETRQGTDALLDFVAATPARLRAPRGRPSGVLYKAPKPGQDWRADLPAIGPETMRRAAAAGLAGVAVQARGVLVLDLEATRAEADRLGLFLTGRPPA